MLESPAISDADKTKLRSGNRSIDLPGPFGIPIGGGERPLESEVILRTDAEPFLTNGNWDESLGTVSFGTRVYPADQRRRMTPPVFHASWAVPNDSMQASIFGEVVFVGQDLGECVFWERTLDDESSEAWSMAIETARRVGSPEALREILDRLEGDEVSSRPAPASLRNAVFGTPGA